MHSVTALALAQQAQDAAMLVAAHRALGATLFWIGAVATAHTHLTQGIALYDPQQHRALVFLYGEDTGVMCHSFAARALWYLGYPDQGLARSQEAVTLAQQSAHPFSLSYALYAAALFSQFRREVRLTQERAEALISLATDQGFPQWKAGGVLLRGWALAQQGQAQEGIEQLHQGLLAWRATGAETLRPYYLTLLVEAYGIMGQPEKGLVMLAEAVTFADKTGERFYEPEMYRLKGHSCSNRLQTTPLKPKPVFSTPSVSPKSNPPNHSNSVQQQALLDSGNDKINARKPMSCSLLCITGSLRDLTQQICRTPRHCWTR